MDHSVVGTAHSEIEMMIDQVSEVEIRRSGIKVRDSETTIGLKCAEVTHPWHPRLRKSLVTSQCAVKSVEYVEESELPLLQFQGHQSRVVVEEGVVQEQPVHVNI